MELDYKKMFEDLQEKTAVMFHLENEFCELMTAIQEKAELSTAVISNMMKMSLADRVLCLRAVSALYDVTEKLQAKYGFEVAEEGEE